MKFQPSAFSGRSAAQVVAMAMIVTVWFVVRAEAVLTQTFQQSGFTIAAEDSRAISAKAVFTIDAVADTITLKLTNMTVDPMRPSQLLTGISFSIADPDGVISNLTLQSATAIKRVVNSNGAYTDHGAVNLLSLNTWMMGDQEASPIPLPHQPSSGTYNATFHPDAQYGIIGNPGADNKYKGMVTPSGQSPYAAESITFVFKSNGIDTNTSIAQVTFGFGTSFQSNLTTMPEASAFLPLLGIVGLAAGVRWARRRVAIAA